MKNTIEFLKTREDGIATYEDVRSHLGLDNSVKKLFKTQEFQRFMKGDVRVPYRTVYPEAEETEWKRKGTPQVLSLNCTSRVSQIPLSPCIANTLLLERRKL